MTYIGKGGDRIPHRARLRPRRRRVGEQRVNDGSGGSRYERKGTIEATSGDSTRRGGMEANALNPNMQPNTFRGRKDIHKAKNRSRVNAPHAEPNRANLLESFQVHFHRFANEVTKSHHEFHGPKANRHIINQYPSLAKRTHHLRATHGRFDRNHKLI